MMMRSLYEAFSLSFLHLHQQSRQDCLFHEGILHLAFESDMMNDDSMILSAKISVEQRYKGHGVVHRVLGDHYQ